MGGTTVAIGLLPESWPSERRVALTPEGVRRLTGRGHRVLVAEGAGRGALISDAEYKDAGAELLPAPQVMAGARILVKVRPPLMPGEGPDEVAQLSSGQILVGLLDPLRQPARMERLAERGVAAFSLDTIPRITRAQSMDVLSSMATLAGYRAAILAAYELPRLFPLLMTAAGTIRPCRVLVLGAGVAGLQAIATARRLGAVVTAFDARMAAKEQVESLGAKFLPPPVSAEGQGGYARALTEEEQKEQLRFLEGPVAESDVVITTAQVPGAPAPRLVTDAMLARMRPGSVVVDLAAETGGNVEGSSPGQVVERHGVRILAPANIPSDLPQQASDLFSRNTVAFLELLLAQLKEDAADPEEFVGGDEILVATLITFRGQVVHGPTKARLAPAERS